MSGFALAFVHNTAITVLHDFFCTNGIKIFYYMDHNILCLMISHQQSSLYFSQITLFCVVVYSRTNTNSLQVSTQILVSESQFLFPYWRM